MKFVINRETPAQKFGYGMVPTELRGTISGKLPARAVRKGGDITNAQYATEHGISRRQASRERRGY